MFGIVGPDVLELDVQLLADGGHLVGQEDVGRRGQPVDEVEALLGADVDADALLAPIGVLQQHVHGAHRRHDAAGGQSAHGVTAFGVLDLDHLGTPVRQDGRGGRHEGVLGHLEDANTFHDVCQRESLPFVPARGRGVLDAASLTQFRGANQGAGPGRALGSSSDNWPTPVMTGGPRGRGSRQSQYCETECTD